jgi:hypothetical protein
VNWLAPPDPNARPSSLMRLTSRPISCGMRRRSCEIMPGPSGVASVVLAPGASSNDRVVVLAPG